MEFSISIFLCGVHEFSLHYPVGNIRSISSENLAYIFICWWDFCYNSIVEFFSFPFVSLVIAFGSIYHSNGANHCPLNTNSIFACVWIIRTTATTTKSVSGKCNLCPHWKRAPDQRKLHLWPICTFHRTHNTLFSTTEDCYTHNTLDPSSGLSPESISCLCQSYFTASK